MAGLTLYLETQALAREAGGVFALDVSPETLRLLIEQGVSAGDTLAVVDGLQDYFACEVRELSADGLLVRFAARDAGASSRPRVHLVQGLSNDEAMDTIVRQVSELGVSGIMPYRSSLSPGISPERADGLRARWEHLARYSARHAGLAAAPDVAPVATFESTCADLAGFDAVIVCWEGARARPMDGAVRDLGLADAGPCDIALVIGPRGGLSDAEVELLSACNPRTATVSLGPAVLRVETAGLVAPALLLSALGGLR